MHPDYREVAYSKNFSAHSNRSRLKMVYQMQMTKLKKVRYNLSGKLIALIFPGFSLEEIGRFPR